MTENKTHPTDDAVNKIEYADTCSEESSMYPPPYYADSGGLYVEVISKTGAVMKKLCNFLPRIISELTVDDGTRITKSYRIGGTDEFGNALPEVDVPATELEKMTWIQNNWKASCDLCVVGQVEKHVRFAIKSTSQYAQQKYFFGYTGWKKIDGEWQYLLPGNPKYSVMLGGKSSSYKIADRVEETDLAYLAGFLQLDFIPREVMYPCLALVFLSPLNEFLNQAGYEPKFVFMLVGTTGAMKSTVAALMLSFFGSFTPARLPMSFHDTANSIMYTAGILKDVLTCVDDYHPTARKDSGIMQQTMQTIARSYGDRTTRERLTSDIQLRESRVPHGNVIVTAEFPPDLGESGTARIFSVEMKRDRIDLSLLTEVQTMAADGMLMRCMYGYIEWLKQEYLSSEDKVNDFVSALSLKYTALRSAWSCKLKECGCNIHGRLPDTLTCLQIGFAMLLKYLRSVGMLHADNEEMFSEAFASILLEHAKKQAESVEDDKPTHRFICKLLSMIESGRVTVLDKDTNTEILPQNFIGYKDSEKYYLSLDESHKNVRRLCGEQGEVFEISSKALAKGLAEEGFIECANGRTTKSIRFPHGSKRVMVLDRTRAEEIYRRA